MNELISRRDALKSIALGAGTILAVGTTAAAATAAATAPANYAALPHVTATDPVVVALPTPRAQKP